MPMYDYKCTECGHVFEVKQSIKDEKLTECPKCKGAVKRLISKGISVKFNGTGFYCTDYADK